MERSSMLLIFLSLLLITHPWRWSAAENSYYACGALYPGGHCYGYCDPGRCCSGELYCQDQSAGLCCWDTKTRTYSVDCYVCSATSQSYGFGGVNQTLGSGTMESVVNATYNNYLDHNHDLDRVVNDSSSTSSSSSSSFSCANSLSVMSIDLRHRHPWAAFPAPEKHVVSKCGLCFKVEKIGAGGGVHDREVKVMIVHEHNNKGIELDSNAFHQLTNSDGSGNGEGLVMVKYQFESC